MARTGTKPTANKTSYVSLPGVPAGQKAISAEFNYLIDKSLNPETDASFTVSVKSDDRYRFGDYTPTGVLNFVKDASVVNGVGIGNGISGIIIHKGFAINFTSDFEVIRNDALTVDARYLFQAVWSGAKFIVLIKKIAVEMYEGGGGIEEAPIDGNQYARKDGDWEIVVGGTGGGTGVFEPVQDITALKALNTTTAANWPDKWVILVEDEGAFYRLDRDSAVSEALPYIVAPTTGVGRWIQDQYAQISDTLYDHIFFAALSPDFGVITRPWDFKVTEKTDTGGTATITTSADAAYTLNATVTAGGYLKVTGDTLNMRSSLKVERA